MHRRVERWAARALVAAGLLALAASSQAATVVQTADFSHIHDYTINLPVFDTNDTAVTQLHFDPFDTALGTLTDVQWRLRSSQDYGTGVSVVGANTADVLANSQVNTAIELGGAKLDPGSSFGSGGFIYCTSLSAPFCVTVVHLPGFYDFDVAAADLAPFTAPGGVDLSLVSTIFLYGSAAGPGLPSAITTETGDLAWNGQLSLTYDYAPASPPVAAPEPSSWALMLAGFGLAGVVLRRRRTAAAAVSISALQGEPT